MRLDFRRGEECSSRPSVCETDLTNSLCGLAEKEALVTQQPPKVRGRPQPENIPDSYF